MATWLPRQDNQYFQIGSSKPKFSNEEYQEYSRLKFNSLAQSSTTLSLSIACISQFMESKNPWIIDPGAYDHMYGNISLFFFLSFSKTQ